jgi:hypothetical protein
MGLRYGTAITHWNNLPPEDQLALHLALDRLAANNPDIVQQLERLADIKENEPAKWEMGVKLLLTQKTTT